MNTKEEEKEVEEQKEFSLKGELSVDFISKSSVIKFDWENKWLKGCEYYHILTNADLYINLYNFEKYEIKTHPDAIYSNPISNIDTRARWDYLLC